MSFVIRNADKLNDYKVAKGTFTAHSEWGRLHKPRIRPWAQADRTVHRVASGRGEGHARPSPANCNRNKAAARRGAALENVIAKGLEQTADYARRAGAAEAHLIIIDRDPERAWDEKIWRRDESCAGLAITVWGA